MKVFLKKFYLFLILMGITLFLSSCEEKSKPNIFMQKGLTVPMKCLKLNTVGLEPEFIETLQELYTFDAQCKLILHLSYKKDIVCNSTHNVVRKSTTKFPKSFLRVDLREGFTKIYTYYIDLYHNVQSNDVEEAFLQLKKDLL